MSVLPPFHLAIPVHDLGAAAQFYEEALGCARGRSAANWIDFDFFGHQLVLHAVADPSRREGANPVDGESIPVPHFGLVLSWNDHAQLSERLTSDGVDFVIQPTTRFEGKVGEQRTFFLRDPCDNFLEFKAFRDPEALFATDIDSDEY